MFTTVDLASEPSNSTEAVEASQAYLEVKNENAVFKQQLNASEAGRQQQQEQPEIRELAHEHYQIELLDRARQWQENFLHRQEEINRLNDIEEKFKQERHEKEDIARRYEKRGKRIEKYTTQQAKSRRVIQSQAELANPGSWSQNRVSVRNYDPRVANSPERAVESWLARLSIPVTPNCFRVTACAPLLAEPDKHQLIVEFNELQMKVEFLTKFPQFATHELKTLRQLQKSDPLETDKRFKQANTQLKCLKGLSTLQKLQNQIVYKIKLTDAYRELNTLADIDNLATHLKALPPTKKAPKKKKKKKQVKQRRNPTTSPTTTQER